MPRLEGLAALLGPDGEVAEWSIAPHSKCGIRATVSGVRIPPSPPVKLKLRINFQFSESYPQQPTHKAFCAAAAVVIVIEPIVSRRLDSSYRSGRSPHWVKVKNPKAPAVKREAEEDWGNKQWSRARRRASY